MNRQTIGVLGSLLLAVGVFAPIVQIPIVGSLTYFQNGHGDGVFVLILAVISLLFVFGRRFRGLLLTGALSLGIMAFTYVNFQARLASLRADMNDKLEGNPFRGIGDAMLGSIQMQWGWGLLLVGAILVVMAGARRTSDSASVATSDVASENVAD